MFCEKIAFLKARRANGVTAHMDMTGFVQVAREKISPQAAPSPASALRALPEHTTAPQVHDEARRAEVDGTNRKDKERSTDPDMKPAELVVSSCALHATAKAIFTCT